jgi:hypothetical protein
MRTAKTANPIDMRGVRELAEDSSSDSGSIFISTRGSLNDELAVPDISGHPFMDHGMEQSPEPSPSSTKTAKHIQVRVE